MHHARIMRDGISFSIGRYVTTERAAVAKRLYKYWMNLDYSFTEIKGEINEFRTVRSTQYHKVPGMNHLVMRVNKDLSLSFGFQFYSGKIFYCNYGYDSLAKAVHARDNKRKLLGLAIEG